ncbi:hypothetical protein GQ600_27155 [Phytophthora cactorum]|nr:hypothetical protein GQ600_27155 [Phytophthora cactorum]
MTEAALAGPTVSLMTRRRASAPPAQPADAVAASSSEAKQRKSPREFMSISEQALLLQASGEEQGDLHKFCDKHRDSANRYQRKLEQKLKEKRMQSRMRALQVQQAQAQAQAQVQTQMVHVQAHTHTSFNVVDPAVINNFMVSPYPGVEMYGAVPNVASGEIAPVSSTVVPFPGHSAVVVPLSSRTGDWTQGEDEYEPYQHPVQLQSEDLDCLDLLFEH